MIIKKYLSFLLGHHIYYEGGGAEIARPDNEAPYRKGGHRETGQRGTRLNRSQLLEHPSAQEKIERAER